MGGRIYEREKVQADHILFDAEFECGNIDQVRQRSIVEYDMWIRNDTNGSGNL